MKLLIADDKKAIREGIKNLLRTVRGPIEIEEAHNGLSAVNMAIVEDYDIILMDINMPIMNGIIATEQIIKIKPDSIIIGLSLNFENHQSIKMKKKGAITCLHKGNLDISLMDTLKKILSEKRVAITS